MSKRESHEPMVPRPQRRVVEAPEQLSADVETREERVKHKHSMIEDYTGVQFWRRKDRASTGFTELASSPLARCSRLMYQSLRDHNIAQAELVLPKLEELFEAHKKHMTALETRHPEDSSPRQRLLDVRWMAWELHRRIKRVLEKMGETERATRFSEEERNQLQLIAERCENHLRTCTNHLIPKAVTVEVLHPLEQNEAALRVLVTATEQALA